MTLSKRWKLVDIENGQEVMIHSRHWTHWYPRLMIMIVSPVLRSRATDIHLEVRRASQ